MSGKKREQSAYERLDNVGRAIVRASATEDRTADEAVQSPFLYARLRTRINAESARREEGERRRALFGVVWRAVPALALVAVFALVLFLSATFSRTGGSYSDEAILDERDAGVERVVFAGDPQPLSSDEVLATILNEDERGASR
jgi:anti-sigma-K factor RskA